jgi:hypothetical protein
MSLDAIQHALLRLAESRNRVETDAPTPEQVDIAAAMLQLARHAPMTGMRIYGGEMTPEDWTRLAGLYRAVSDQAAMQARTAAPPTPPSVSLSQMSLAQPEPVVQGTQRLGCPPVPPASQTHEGRHQDGPDEKRVEQDGQAGTESQ